MSNAIKTVLQLGAWSALLLGIGKVLGGTRGLVVGFVFALVMQFGSYWFSDRIVLGICRARAVGPRHRLRDLIASRAQRAGLPMPAFDVIPETSPNAFAAGRNPARAAVAATEGLLDVMDDEDLAGAMAHELARVREDMADATDIRIAGPPMGLVSALRKIEGASRRFSLEASPATAQMFVINLFSAGGLLSLFSTHPRTERRIRTHTPLTRTS